MSSTHQNPFLPGFNPDPSILRVEDDYYVATSTFEWFPGVQIHHSKDLVNWELIYRPLNRRSQLDMLGGPDSGGVWAPCLSYCDGEFFLVYSDVKELRGNFKASRNYIVTCDKIDGDWSDPIHLNVSGFDQSLFHDPTTGKKYLLWLIWDDRPGNNPFHAIRLQEYDHESKQLVGEARTIFNGTELGCTEGPHLYHINGYYYLMTAEGGTGWDHAVTLCRSEKIEGPYEVCPHNPILTSRGKHDSVLKRAGHASIVETQEGEWFLAHLCSRPIPGRGRSTMGRESALQKVVWTDDGWLQMHHGENHPDQHAPIPMNFNSKVKPRDNSRHYTFDQDKLHIDFQTLRVPLDDKRLSLSERPGHLRLKGELSFCTRMEQSMIARRQQAHRFTATTCLDFQPTSFLQRAGLVYYYSSQNYIYAALSHDEKLGRSLTVLIAEKDIHFRIAIEPIALPENGPVHLRAIVNYDDLRLAYSLDGETWRPVGRVFDSSFLSDEAAGAHENFTGAFIGLCCQDMTGSFAAADFSYLDYQERGDEAPTLKNVDSRTDSLLV
ncbi:glycoside hydrolase family 43 protein [Pelagicoccus mobilis]|uniref:Glycoside hydrolase family 43 protein n=1 Tax=Pelagicoccus mobilis TaxID=415221 RepID=A0A934RSI9_9BACT|nr:glycoside hydrolase family 43 protein [Pelagicoccus mobilis]MBK1875576.1 glycoside hydrolase family 43 protein [Pelagicoccus mobilis]